MLSLSVPPLSRANYTRLSTAGFADVNDYKGQPAHHIDPLNKMFKPDLEKDLADSLLVI